jgi:hypothetical protein
LLIAIVDLGLLIAIGDWWIADLVIGKLRIGVWWIADW